MKATPTQVHRGVAIGANNEVILPGRVPHVRFSVHGPKKMGRSPFLRYC
jgi:hypothetical protein